MTQTSTVEVPSDALRQAVCVIDGLTRALDQVARDGRPGPGESARQDVTTLRELGERV
jgi:hypothetical protein